MDDLQQQTFNPGVAEAGGPLPAPAEPTFGVGTEQPQVFGVQPNPVSLIPKAPANADSVSAQYAAVTGEDPAKIRQEMDSLGPYRILDRAWGTSFTKQQAAIKLGISNAIDLGNPEEAYALSKEHVTAGMRYEADQHTLLEKQIGVATDATRQAGNPAAFKSDGEFEDTVQKAGEKRGFFNEFLNKAEPWAEGYLNWAQSTLSHAWEQYDIRYLNNPEVEKADMVGRVGWALKQAAGPLEFVVEGGHLLVSQVFAGLHGVGEAVRKGDVHAYAPAYREFADAMANDPVYKAQTTTGKAMWDTAAYALEEWVKDAGAVVDAVVPEQNQTTREVVHGIVDEVIPMALGLKGGHDALSTRALVRDGQAARVVQKAAGNEAAAKMVGEQLATAADGTAPKNTTDLSTHDAATSASSVGTNVYEPHPLNLEGLPSKLQKQLVEDAQAAQAKIDAALELVRKSGSDDARPGEPPAAPPGAAGALETTTEQTKLVGAYDPAVRSDVHSIELWEGGPKANFVSPDGTPFMSEAGARNWMAEHGLTGEIVDVRDLAGQRFAEQARQQAINDRQIADYQNRLDNGDQTVPFPGSPEAKAAAERTVKMNAEPGAKAELASNMQETSAHLERRREIINQTRDRFDNSATPVLGTARTPRAHVNMVARILEKVGLGNEKVLLGHMDELADLHPDIEAHRVGSAGLYLRPEGDRPFHVILTNDIHAGMQPGAPLFARVKAMTTITHEIGHLIWNKIIASDQWKPVRTAIVRAFEEDAKNNPGDAALYARNRQAPNLISGAKEGRFTVEDMAARGAEPAFKDWIKSHEERFVENLSKAMYKDERTLTPIEKALKPIVDVMRKMYEAASQALKLKTDEAHPLVDRLFKKLLDDVAAGTFDQSKLTFSERDAGFRRSLDTPPPRDTGPEGYVIRRDEPGLTSRATEGRFTEEDINGAHYYSIDPKHGASIEAVEARLAGVHVQERVAGALRDLIKKPWSKLDKSSRKLVENVLVEGDKYRNLDGTTGREFTATELMESGLSEKEMAAYFAVRQARNMMHAYRDAEMVRDLSAQGFENLIFSVVEGGRPATASASAVPGVGRHLTLIAREADPVQMHGRYVWDSRANKAVTLTPETLNGGALMEMRDPQQINGKWFKHAIVDSRSGRRGAITTVLPFRKGEFARIYTDEYFAEIHRTGQVDGVADPAGFKQAVRTARSEKEAKAYVDSMNAAKEYLDAVNAGEIVSRNPLAKVEELIGHHTDPQRFLEQHAAGEFADAKFTYKYTRTKDEYLTDFTGSALAERPFYGHRGERLFAVDERRPNTLSVMKSLEAEVSNLSRAVTIGDWRRTMIQKWMNTFGDQLGETGRSGNDIADFYKAGDENGMLRFTKNDPRSRFAQNTYNYIRKQLGVRTAEERAYQNGYRAFTEFMESKGWMPATVGAFIRQTSFLNLVRSINFNLTLGLFNPAQLLVQANGMMTAAAIHPLHGLVAAKTYPILRMALMSDRVDVHKAFGTMNKLTDLGLSNVNEFVNLVAAVRKTGIIENLRSTALHNLEDGKLGITTGWGGKTLAAGRWFFNRGEEAARLVSFDIARREFKDRNPGVDWTTNESLNKIVARMDDYTQNMTKANQAAWQRGIMSMPGQFLRYNVNLAQNMAGAAVRGVERLGGSDKPYRGFTSAEMSKIMIAHLVMYGAAGYGLVNMMDEILGDKLSNSMTPVEKQYIAEGAIAGIIAQMTADENGEGGTQISVGSRLASFDMWTRLGKAVFSKDTTIYDAILGPTKGTVDHAAAAANIVKLWSKGAAGSTPEAIIDAFKAFTTEEVASLRNATRAYYYWQNAGRMIDKNGTPIAQLKNQEILAAALGFQPTQATDYYNLLQDKKQVSAALDDVAKDIYKLQREAILAANRDDWPVWEKKNAQIRALWPENAGDYQEVKRRIKDNLFPYDTEMQKVLGEYMQHSYHPDRTTPFTATTPAGSNPAYGK